MTKSRSSRVKYSKVVPQDSFLGDFLKYMDPLETPYAYDFWTAVYTLSVSVGRSIVVNRPLAPVYLNVFAILVAESGVTRKSTAVRHGTKLARLLAHESMELVEAKITPELLEYKLHKQSEEHGRSGVAISISELVTFLGREKYVSSMPTLLTDLYDCPELRGGGGSLSSGDRTLRNVFVSFLSASTPSWLIRAVNPDVIEGGFTSRVMFIVAEEPKRRQSWPEGLDEDIEGRLLKRLHEIRTKAERVARIEISPGGRSRFDKWYKGRLLHRDPFRASFQSREDAHILRLAAFLCINDGTYVIQSNHISAAISIITEVREDGASIFEGTGSNSRLVQGIDKIRDSLLAAGINGRTQTEITKAVSNFINAEEMKTVLDIFHELDMVQRFDIPSTGRGRPKTLWRGKAALSASNAIDLAIEKHSPGR